MVEVFKTNVESEEFASRIVSELEKNFPGYRINFDLSDCDRILRVQSAQEYISPEEFISALAIAGFRCEVLED